MAVEIEIARHREQSSCDGDTHEQLAPPKHHPGVSNMKAANNNVKADYDEPWCGAVMKAEATGREHAVNAIFEQVMAVRDRAYSGHATHETCKARGALHVWRAAYAAAYREMLAIEDELKAYAQGAGLMDTIPERTEEMKRGIEA